jgi:hypothetical protein
VAKPKGWRNEPSRHALAARGVSTWGGRRHNYRRFESFEGYPRLNLEKDTKAGLVNSNYARKDALDDVVYSEMAVMAISDEFEGEDAKKFNELSASLFDSLNDLFEDPTALSEEDIHLWEKWLNIAYNQTKNGSDFDRADAYLDAIEKYAIRLQGIADHPRTIQLANQTQWYSHDLLKMWT